MKNRPTTGLALDPSQSPQARMFPGVLGLPKLLDVLEMTERQGGLCPRVKSDGEQWPIRSA